MTTGRRIDWPGFHNARDLGGLPTRDGRRTRFGAFVRSADPRFVTPEGWRAARNVGIRTIVDLRNADEIPGENGAPPDIDRVEVPLDGREDTEFWRTSTANCWTAARCTTGRSWHARRIAASR